MLTFEVGLDGGSSGVGINEKIQKVRPAAHHAVFYIPLPEAAGEIHKSFIRFAAVCTIVRMESIFTHE